MKIIYNVAKMDTHRKGKDGLPVGTYGAIIFYGKDRWFVDLELKEDREKFDKFVEETSDEDKWSWEDTLPSILCVEDVDIAWYKYYVDGECINDKDWKELWVMTKRECMDYIYHKLNEYHDEQLRRIKNKTGNAHEAITECYEHCKQICADNGYIGECYNNLWNMAIHRLRKKNKIKAYFCNM